VPTKDFGHVTVRANWRVMFRFDHGAHDVDDLDDHERETER